MRSSRDSQIRPGARRHGRQRCVAGRWRCGTSFPWGRTYGAVWPSGWSRRGYRAGTLADMASTVRELSLFSRDAAAAWAVRTGLVCARVDRACRGRVKLAGTGEAATLRRRVSLAGLAARDWIRPPRSALRVGEERGRSTGRPAGREEPCLPASRCSGATRSTGSGRPPRPGRHQRDPRPTRRVRPGGHRCPLAPGRWRALKSISPEESHEYHTAT